MIDLTALDAAADEAKPKLYKNEVNTLDAVWPTVEKLLAKEFTMRGVVRFLVKMNVVTNAEEKQFYTALRLRVWRKKKKKEGAAACN